MPLGSTSTQRKMGSGYGRPYLSITLDKRQPLFNGWEARARASESADLIGAQLALGTSHS